MACCPGTWNTSGHVNETNEAKGSSILMVSTTCRPPTNPHKPVRATSVVSHAPETIAQRIDSYLKACPVPRSPAQFVRNIAHSSKLEPIQTSSSPGNSSPQKGIPAAEPAINRTKTASGQCGAEKTPPQPDPSTARVAPTAKYTAV